MTQSKKRRIVGIVIAVVIVIVLVWILVAVHGEKQSAVVPSNDTSKQQAAKTTDEQTKTNTDAQTGTNSDTTQVQSQTPVADPATLSSVDVAPLGITVSYTKGTPGFEYTVDKTADNTQYVEFTSTDLVGTKCTDDEGLIASIIENPTSTENQTTISQTIKVGSNTYGLSLASPGCTANTDLLTQYQAGFKDGFSSLKAL